MDVTHLSRVLGRTHARWRTNWKSHLRTFVLAAAVVMGIQA